MHLSDPQAGQILTFQCR